MIVAIVQARMGSTRLPGKVMMDLCGKPVLWHIIDRLKHASCVDYILIATTQEKGDNIIEEFGKSWDIPVFRGPTTDVLGRFHDAVNFVRLQKGNVDAVVRITADCPFVDPRVVDDLISDLGCGNYDYVSNVDPPTFPDGLDVEVFSVSALEEAYFHASLASEREHVTPYIRNNSRIRKFNRINNRDLSGIRLTLDTDKDFVVISQIYEALYRSGHIFFLDDIIRFLKEHQSLLEINAEYGRNEGYQKSLENDHTL